MTGLAEDTMRAEAIAWHLQLSGGADADWDGFARWLEADPRHNAMYEAVYDADQALDPVAELARDSQEPAFAWFTPIQTSRARRWKWPGMAAAAALVAFGSWVGMGGLNSEYAVSTAPGEMRTLTLADGTRIMLNGGSTIELDKTDTRVAELKAGEAQFTVHHDAQQPFTLTVGDQRIVDEGTVFNVRRAKTALRVEVAEGGVRFENGVNRLRLTAGDTLEANESGIVEGAKAVGDIGGWTRGRLVYRDTPLMEVAADITRARGIAIELGPDLSDRRFSGVIQLDGDAATLQKRIGVLLGLKVAATADGWSISR